MVHAVHLETCNQVFKTSVNVMQVLQLMEYCFFQNRQFCSISTDCALNMLLHIGGKQSTTCGTNYELEIMQSVPRVVHEN